jgi:Tfp pilus assembly protein PilF
MPRLPTSQFRLAALLVSLTAAAAVAAHGAAHGASRTHAQKSIAAARPVAQPSKRGAQSSTRAAQASSLVAQGITALEGGDAANAKNFFQRALSIDPKNVAAHTYLGALADRAGELEEAETHFAAAALAAPRSPQALNNYGAILFRRGRTEQSAAQFEASLKLDARQPSALVNLAQIRFAAGTPADLRAARTLFERARAITPDREIARALTVIALRLSEREAAKNYYREYASPPSGASAGANGEAAAVVSPQSRAELGAALLEAELFDEAVAELDAAVAADPSNVEAIVNLARSYRARKDVTAAGRLLEATLARGLEDARVFAALADLYESIGRVENAIPAMRLAVERAPANEEYRFRYALLLINSQAPKAAVIRVQEALQAFPRSAKLWFALGLAYMTEHQSAEASPALARAVELDPRAAPALAYLGLAHAEQGRYDEAIVFYERAVGVNEQLATVHYLLADILLKRNPSDTERPERSLLRAVELDPTLASARLALGKLYFRTDRLESAAEQLQCAVALDPNSAETHYQLGRVYTRLKRTAEAQAALATFKRLNEGQKEQAQNDRREIVRRLANVHF